MTSPTTPDEQTRAAEARDAASDHDAEQVPTSDEAAEADEHAPVSDDVAEAYREQVERGAEVEGEGKIA